MLTEQFKVSVIIPMYNVQEYIESCLNSIFKQSLKEIEIICIDDGSTDATLEIVGAYIQENNNIRLLKQNHAGSGPARNLGIKSASGKYVAFLDADDYFYDNDALEKMVKACEESNVSICGSNRMTLWDNELVDGLLFQGFDIPCETGRKMSFAEFQEDYHYQSFIFKREMLVDNDIYFPDYLRYQDPPFFLKAMLKAKEFWVMPVYLYCYRYGHQNNELIASRIHYILQGILDNLRIVVENDYEILYHKIMNRLNNDYKEMILMNLSDKSLSILLEISRINHTYEKNVPIEALDRLYILQKKFHIVARSNDIMMKIVKIQQSKLGFKQYFENHNISNVVVYGVGEYGKILIRILEECEVEIRGCVDRKVKEFYNYRMISPEDEIPECDALIVSLLCGEEIAQSYKKRGVKTVVTFPAMVEEIRLE